MAEKVKGIFKKGHKNDTNTELTGPAQTPAYLHEETNEPGGVALTDESGNLKPGPHTDAVKRESIVTKIKEKLPGGSK